MPSRVSAVTLTPRWPRLIRAVPSACVLGAPLSTVSSATSGRVAPFWSVGSCSVVVTVGVW